MHDPRAGRFFATDPLEAKYPWYSPYQFSGNRVIDMVELEGLEPADAPYKNKEGTVQVAHDRQRISTGDYGPWEILEVLRTEWHWHNGGVEGSARGWYKKDDYEKLIAPIAVEYAQQNGNSFAFEWQGARAMLNRDKSCAATEPSGDVKGFISNRNLKEGYLDYLLDIGNKIIDSYNKRIVYMASGHVAPMDFDSPFLIVGAIIKPTSVSSSSGLLTQRSSYEYSKYATQPANTTLYYNQARAANGQFLSISHPSTTLYQRGGLFTESDFAILNSNPAGIPFIITNASRIEKASVIGILAIYGTTKVTVDKNMNDQLDDSEKPNINNNEK